MLVRTKKAGEQVHQMHLPRDTLHHRSNDMSSNYKSQSYGDLALAHSRLNYLTIEPLLYYNSRDVLKGAAL